MTAKAPTDATERADTDATADRLAALIEAATDAVRAGRHHLALRLVMEARDLAETLKRKQ